MKLKALKNLELPRDQKEKLFHKSAPIFKILSVDRKINALKQKKVSIEPDDLNDLNDIDFNHIRNAQKDGSDFLQTEAFPILISDRVYFNSCKCQFIKV